MAAVTLYGRPDCHLCDEARAVVLMVREELEFELLEVDVSRDPALLRHYGERIPVLTLDGREEFQYRVDAARLRSLLRRRPRNGR